MSPNGPEPGGLAADPDAVIDRAGLAAALARTKAETGLSFRALAARTEESGVPLLPFTTIRDYVQGRSLPSPERLDIVLGALGLPADDPARERWRAALHRASARPDRPPAELRPYPGARPFTAADARWFRGREDEVAEVLERVRAGGVVPVVGASGAGVSSVLRAGVLPALPGPVAVLEPGPDPAGRLAALCASGATVLVDGADELGTDVLTDLLAGDGAPGCVLLGLRESHFADLAGADPPTPVRIGPPSVEALCRMMTEPAREAGFALAEGLPDLLLGELEITPGAAEVAPGALAWTAAALAAAWERLAATGGTEVTIAHYREAGGLHAAIADAAERAYGELSEEARRVTRPLLLRAVRLQGTHGDAVTVRRRFRRIGPLYGLGAGEAAALREVVGRLVEGRVLVEQAETIELSHDLVLRSWPRLAEWIRADRERRPARGLLTEAAKVWVDAGRDEGALLRGRLLDEAAAFAARPGAQEELFPLERELLAVSQAARAGSAVAQRRRIRRLQTLVGALLVLLVLAVVVAVVAVTGTG